MLGDTSLERKLAHFSIAMLQACRRCELLNATRCNDNIHYITHARTILLAMRPIYNQERLDTIRIPQKRRTGRPFTAVRGRAPAAWGRRYHGKNDICGTLVRIEYKTVSSGRSAKLRQGHGRLPGTAGRKHGRLHEILVRRKNSRFADRK